MNNFDSPIILIAGGEDKNLSYEKWKKELKNKVKYIFLIGRCAKRMKKELDEFNTEIVHNIERAVKKAYMMAKEKDIILLSPGCSSYDQFKNYECRGEEFKRMIRLIEIEKGEK